MLIDLEQLPDEGKYLSVEFHAQYNEKLFNIKLFEGYIFRNRSDFLLEGKLSFDVKLTYNNKFKEKHENITLILTS